MLVLYYTAEVNKFAHYFSEIITLQTYIGICSDLGGFATCFVDEVKSCMCHFLVGEHTGWQKKIKSETCKERCAFCQWNLCSLPDFQLEKASCAHCANFRERERDRREKWESNINFSSNVTKPFSYYFCFGPKGLCTMDTRYIYTSVLRSSFCVVISR